MTYFAHNQATDKQRRRQRGVSLVEVLVALVLLVVGIYSVARLFPGGFFSIRGAQNATFADRLAQAQIEQLKENSGYLLDAVYMYGDNGMLLPSYNTPAENPATDFNNDYPSLQNPDPYYDDINKARFISGESFKVGAPNVSTNNSMTNGVSLYVLQDGPALLSNGALAGPPALTGSATPTPMSPANVYGLPQVHTGPWTARQGAAPSGINDPADYGTIPGAYDQPSDLLASGGPVYAIDYTNEQIAVSPQQYQQPFTFVIKGIYSVPPSTSGGTATTETVTYYYPLLLPASTGTNGYAGAWFVPATYLDSSRAVVTDVAVPTASGVAFQGWMTGSAKLYRTMSRVMNVSSLTMNNTGPDTDPYTFAISSSDTVDAALTNATMGILAINPRIAGQTVSVSYLAYDWHIIHENDDVPSSDGSAIPSPIHLTIDHLKRVGDVQNDQTVYPGLFHLTEDATAPYDIVILDTDTGQSIGLAAPSAGTTPQASDALYDLDNQPSGNVSPDQFAVSYQNGYVTLPTSAGASNASQWTSVSHAHVRIFYEGDYGWAVALQKAPSLYAPGQDGNLAVGQYAVAASGNSIHLHFPLCDLGQTVEVDDIHYTDTNGIAQTVPTVTGSIATDYVDTLYVDLGSSLPNVNTADTITIGAVRGISARAVVIWKERDQWRTRSVNTILTGSE